MLIGLLRLLRGSQHYHFTVINRLMCLVGLPNFRPLNCMNSPFPFILNYSDCHVDSLDLYASESPLRYGHYCNCLKPGMNPLAFDIFEIPKIRKCLVRFPNIFCCYCEPHTFHTLLEAQCDQFWLILLVCWKMFCYFPVNAGGYINPLASMIPWFFSFRCFSGFSLPFISFFFSILRLKILQAKDFWFAVGSFSSILIMPCAYF